MSDILESAWRKRAKLFVEGNRIFDESKALYVEADKLFAESSKCFIKSIKKCHADTDGNRFFSRGLRLFAKSENLGAKADKLRIECMRLLIKSEEVFVEAVLEVYGYIAIRWSEGGCRVAEEEFEDFDPEEL